MGIAHTTAIQRCIERLDANHADAREELLRLTYDRLLVMIRGLMARYPRLRRWEQSDDVLANVHVRLLRCFDRVAVVSACHFLSLAATNMRRELIDLCRHYYGDEGLGTNHATPCNDGEGEAALAQEAGRGRDDPAILAEWAELHEHVARLPDEEREVMDLHWYHDLSQREVAALLCVSLKTVKRRWVAAKARLAARLGRPVLI